MQINFGIETLRIFSTGDRCLFEVDLLVKSNSDVHLGISKISIVAFILLILLIS